VKAADKSLKKEGASIEKYNPFFSKRFIESFWPHLNMKLFPGIGIKLIECLDKKIDLLSDQSQFQQFLSFAKRNNS
jgi:hypothetical protein